MEQTKHDTLLYSKEEYVLISIPFNKPLPNFVKLAFQKQLEQIRDLIAEKEYGKDTIGTMIVASGKGIKMANNPRLEFDANECPNLANLEQRQREWKLKSTIKTLQG